jgi:hypothetical protein
VFKKMPFTLKEEDELINWFHLQAQKIGMLRATELCERLVNAHNKSPMESELRVICPHIRTMHKQLNIVGALKELDDKTHLLNRRHILPTFSEIRQILNLSVVHACAESVNLVTLDADDTLYSDGGTITADSPMIPVIVRLLRLGLNVALASEYCLCVPVAVYV